jgi:hypothetical protein
MYRDMLVNVFLVLSLMFIANATGKAEQEGKITRLRKIYEESVFDAVGHCPTRPRPLKLQTIRRSNGLYELPLTVLDVGTNVGPANCAQLTPPRPCARF